jgi:hypothetical protein
MDKQSLNKERIAFLNSKTEELAEKQEEELITNYDEALNEYKNKSKPHKIKFKGRIFEIPRSMPFSFSMFYMKYCITRQGGKTIFSIPEERVNEFIEKMFGKGFLKTLNHSDDVDMDFILSVLIPDIFDKWGYGIKTPEKNAQTPGL